MITERRRAQARALVERWPVLAYTVLCYAISWSVWFSIPLVTRGDWSMVKVFVGVGMGPGIAAVLLDRLRGDAGPTDGRWRIRFAIVFVVVCVLNTLTLAVGDAQSAHELHGAAAAGLSVVGIIGVLLSGAVCAFIFACAASSRSSTLHSILRWRVAPQWWSIAALLPAALLLIALGIAHITSQPAVSPRPSELRLASWIVYVVRSFLFTLFVVGIGEETGWRGWLLPELLKRYSALRSSIVLGVLWGAWHFPLFVIDAYTGPASGIVEYFFVGPLLALLFTWLWLRSGGNLLLAIVLHASLNNAARMIPSAPASSALLLLTVIAVVVGERMWRPPGVPRITPLTPSMSP